MTGKITILPLLATLMLAFIVAGCGDSSEAKPLKKSQFVEEANSICRDAAAERNDAMREAAGGNPEAAEFVNETILPPIQQMAEELSDLGAPVGDEKEVRAIVAAFEKGVKKVEADPSDLSAGVTAFDHADELALDYGLVDCTI